MSTIKMSLQNLFNIFVKPNQNKPNNNVKIELERTTKFTPLKSEREKNVSQTSESMEVIHKQPEVKTKKTAVKKPRNTVKKGTKNAKN